MSSQTIKIFSFFENIFSILLHFFNNRYIFAKLKQRQISTLNTIHILTPKFYAYENQDFASFDVGNYD